MFQKIVLASDGSEYALRAARSAAEIARASDADVVLVHVLDLPAVALSMAGSGFSLPTQDIGRAERYYEEIGQAVAARTIEEFGDRAERVTVRLERGRPADVICRVAEEEGADLVVVGSHGLSEWQSLLLGSTSDRVAHHAPCAVLMVR